MSDNAVNAITELHSLFKSLGSFRKSEEAKKFFDFVASFPRLAPYNAMLVYVQKPGSRMVASAAVWRSKYRRRIKLDARPLLVLWPNGPVGVVFDIGDTAPVSEEDATNVPELAVQPFQARGDLPPDMLRLLLSNLPGQGIVMLESEMGSLMGGGISALKGKYFQDVMKKQVRALYGIRIARNADAGTLFTILTHELGHLFCGHLSSPAFASLPRNGRIPKRYDLQKRSGKELEKIREIEAESVAWLVCKRLGIDTSAQKYMDGYLEDDGTLPEINMEAIIKAVGRIEKLCHEECAPYKPLIIDLESMAYRERREWAMISSCALERCY